jgi:hypothetical protein
MEGVSFHPEHGGHISTGVDRGEGGMTAQHPASWLRTVRTTHATLVVDYRSGSIAMLHGEAKTIWGTYTEGQQPHRPDARADPVTADFAKRGWLSAADSAAPPVVVHLGDDATSWGTQETAAALGAIGYAPWLWRLAAVPAVGLVLLVRQFSPHRRFARLLRLTRLGARLPMASDLQARHAIRAVRRAARLIPAKVACLEESVAAAVLLAATGRHATWCHGIALDPVRLHAWIAARNGDPLEEPPSTTRYTVINQPLPQDREGDH